MSLPARAAAIRGDDLQHAIGWYWACQLLRDPDIESVSIEDASGGAFDDIVIRRRSSPGRYLQVKSSNYGGVVVDEDWLLTAASSGGHSPLKHFYDTYTRLRATEEPFELELVTTRPFDHTDPFLGELRDSKTNRIRTALIAKAGARSRAGKTREAWAAHLNASTGDLLAFLDAVTWNHCQSEATWLRDTKPLMELAGLRTDDEATKTGARIVHDWVTDGRGPQTLEDVRSAVAKAGLLAVEGTLVFAVHGIDRDPTPVQPNVTLDFVDLYAGESSFSRKVLKSQDDWNALVLPAFDRAAKALSSYRIRRVYVTGSMRHPMWFATGRALPEVKRWALSLDQVGATWHTDVAPEETEPRLLADERVDQGSDLAVAIALTADPTVDVRTYLLESGTSVGRLLVLGPEGDPSKSAVPSDAWAMGWTRAARERIRSAAAEVGAVHVHLFFVCPAAVALMLGHQWNMLPPTTVYEYTATYVPTAIFDGA